MTSYPRALLWRQIRQPLKWRVLILCHVTCPWRVSGSRSQCRVLTGRDGFSVQSRPNQRSCSLVGCEQNLIRTGLGHGIHEASMDRLRWIWWEQLTTVNQAISHFYSICFLQLTSPLSFLHSRLHHTLIYYISLEKKRSLNTFHWFVVIVCTLLLFFVCFEVNWHNLLRFQ